MTQPASNLETQHCISKLKKLVEKYHRSSSASIAKEAHEKLSKILDKANQSDEDKIISFYVFIWDGYREARSASEGSGLRLNYLDIIKRYDPSKSSARFIAGILSVLASLLLLPISIPLIAGVYAKTGRHPLDLFKTHAEQFQKDINLVTKKYGQRFFTKAKDQIQHPEENREERNEQYSDDTPKQ